MGLPSLAEDVRSPGTQECDARRDGHGHLKKKGAAPDNNGYRDGHTETPPARGLDGVSEKTKRVRVRADDFAPFPGNGRLTGLRLRH